MCQVQDEDEEWQPDEETSDDSLAETRCSGVVHMQKHGKHEFSACWMEVANGRLLLREEEGGGVVATAALFGCTASTPKHKRKGFPHALRLDLDVATGSVVESKYVLALGSAEELGTWTECEAGVLIKPATTR